MTTVLGIKPCLSNQGAQRWGNHDPGACLIRDGDIVAMIEEERFKRIKKAPRPSFPKESVRYVLNEGGIDISDVDVVSIGMDHKEYAKVIKREPTSLLPTSLKSAYDSLHLIETVVAAHKGSPVQQVSDALNNIFDQNFTGEFHEVPHHKCHATSAAYCSGFDEQVTITIDGRGESDSTVIWDTDLNRIKEFPVSQSLGKFYGRACKYLGFRGGRDAGKVMGLASYGTHRSDFAETFSESVKITEGDYDIVHSSQSSFVEKFGPSRKHGEEITQRHKDFAYHLQQRTEEVVKELVKHYTDQTGINTVALAGGVAMNCKLNREVLNMDYVDNLFIQPAANDSGICLGAALEGYRLATGVIPHQEFNHIYYGTEYSNSEIRTAIERSKLQYDKKENICEVVAELLADGNLVGWYQGRMEFGARALGNRSILADPRSQESLERVNANVKHRELWRPFAPSLLYESRDKYLVHGDNSPFMILLDSVKESKRDEVEAITHVDGTTRPQTVKKSQNEKYHRLIKKFENVTGVPVVLNTSFNVAGEPIVESPQQAIADFYTTGLDALAIGDYLLTKPINST